MRAWVAGSGRSDFLGNDGDRYGGDGVRRVTAVMGIYFYVGRAWGLVWIRVIGSCLPLCF